MKDDVENPPLKKKVIEKIKEKKLLIIILGFAIYLIILSFVFVPLQGGLISSTQIMPPVDNLPDQYESDLPLQEFFGIYGRSIAIAFLMLSHVLYANLHLGGSWVAVTSESLYIKNGTSRFNRLSRSITLFNVMLFSLGTTFATGGILLFIVFVPNLASILFHIYWWPLFLELIAFFLEVFFLYTYWFSWDKIKTKYHQILGYGYAITVFFQTLFINMVAAGMLTPGTPTITFGSDGIITMSTNDLISWWFNPTTWILTFHRFAAAISVFGFILILLAMFHYKDRPDIASKKYWDWVGSWGMMWGLFGLVFQPILGLLYVNQLFYSVNPAFQMMMHGPRAWEMLLVVALISALFLIILVYYIDRKEEILNREENAKYKKLFDRFLIISAICAFFLVQPSWLGDSFEFESNSVFNPLGIMGIKYIALLILMIIGILIVAIDVKMLKKMKEGEWGKLSSVSRYAGILTGIIGMFIVIVMGYVRESSRAPYAIFGILPVAGSSTHPTPIAIDRLFIVFGLIMITIIAVFWFTSKVTAHHPEEMEQLYSVNPDKKNETIS
ncbi:MAG: cytochrome ubiquinol oxidase subunit I [Promethearchaeota archaeon]